VRLLPAGEAAILVELPHPDDVLPLTAGLASDRLAAVTDLVPAERTVLVAFDPALAAADQVAHWIRGTAPIVLQGAAGGLVTIEVRYDGPDLADVAGLLGLSTAEVIAQHTGTVWTVAFSGFAPGFAYLRPPDGRLTVPRRDTARPRVPAGSVALAAGYTGIYPRPSPGGWRLIGTTSVSLWTPDAAPPALLTPGTQVRFSSA
jgi:KipI family sensor histidine kinase inhibitor